MTRTASGNVVPLTKKPQRLPSLGRASGAKITTRGDQQKLRSIIGLCDGDETTVASEGLIGS